MLAAAADMRRRNRHEVAALSAEEVQGGKEVRVGTQYLLCAFLVQTQVPAQLLRSLDSATGGAPLQPPARSIKRFSKLSRKVWKIRQAVEKTFSTA